MGWGAGWQVRTEGGRGEGGGREAWRRGAALTPGSSPSRPAGAPDKRGRPPLGHIAPGALEPSNRSGAKEPTNRNPGPNPGAPPPLAGTRSCPLTPTGHPTSRGASPTGAGPPGPCRRPGRPTARRGSTRGRGGGRVGARAGRGRGGRGAPPLPHRRLLPLLPPRPLAFQSGPRTTRTPAWALAGVTLSPAAARVGVLGGAGSACVGGGAGGGSGWGARGGRRGEEGSVPPRAQDPRPGGRRHRSPLTGEEEAPAPPPPAATAWSAAGCWPLPSGDDMAVPDRRLPRADGPGTGARGIPERRKIGAPCGCGRGGDATLPALRKVQGAQRDQCGFRAGEGPGGDERGAQHSRVTAGSPPRELQGGARLRTGRPAPPLSPRPLPPRHRAAASRNRAPRRSSLRRIYAA